MTPAETRAQIEADYAAWHARVTADLVARIPPGNDLRIENHDVREPDDQLSHGEQAGLDKARSAAMYGGAL